MEKYKNEQLLTKRLREYLESILSKIMIHSPEILEVNTNTPNGNNNVNNSSQKNSVSLKKFESNSNVNNNNKKQRENSKTGNEIFSFRKNSDRVFQL